MSDVGFYSAPAQRGHIALNKETRIVFKNDIVKGQSAFNKKRIFIFIQWQHKITPFYSGNGLRGVGETADPDQMPHNVASDPGLHYFASCSAMFQQKYLSIT